MIKSTVLWCKIVLLALMMVSAVTLFVWQTIYQLQHVQHQAVTIPVGASGLTVSRLLEQKGIISSARYFRWLSRLSGKATSLKPGLYDFDGQLHMIDVLNILSKGEIQQFKVTIPEGLRTDEMLILLAQHTHTSTDLWQKALLSITQGDEFEGLFLPETYFYTKPVQPLVLLQQMFDARSQVEATLATELAWSAKQIRRNRIMASIVEKETALPHERVWVSAAIHNRLRLSMPLQMDPTVIYGLYQTQGNFSGNIRRQDLRKDTPWNTYTRQGLPITPIANPGKASLRAAAYPADVNYLYFVADGTGGHAFASSLEQHNANVRKWLKIERANR